ncbi:unnamed protein product [Prorocentrum cordatum]|uniref:Uncharacterized protein n=1 Tax=Prorocentrum cordatum TaxID=2364126 RepID=A0ABN9U8V7_9DINO|nr:unnamed protein product [Polarella glacialis]
MKFFIADSSDGQVVGKLLTDIEIARGSEISVYVLNVDAFGDATLAAGPSAVDALEAQCEPEETVQEGVPAGAAHDQPRGFRERQGSQGEAVGGGIGGRLATSSGELLPGGPAQEEAAAGGDDGIVVSGKQDKEPRAQVEVWPLRLRQLRLQGLLHDVRGSPACWRSAAASGAEAGGDLREQPNQHQQEDNQVKENIQVDWDPYLIEEEMLEEAPAPAPKRNRWSSRLAANKEEIVEALLAEVDAEIRR